MSRLDLLQRLFFKYEQIKETKETWFHQEKFTSVMLKPNGNHYHGYIIHYQRIYQFDFQPGKAGMVQVVVRENNLYVKISGIHAMRAFIDRTNLSLIETVYTSGANIRNFQFWKELFKQY